MPKGSDVATLCPVGKWAMFRNNHITKEPGSCLLRGVHRKQTNTGVFGGGRSRVRKARVAQGGPPLSPEGIWRSPVSSGGGDPPGDPGLATAGLAWGTEPFSRNIACLKL